MDVNMFLSYYDVKTHSAKAFRIRNFHKKIAAWFVHNTSSFSTRRPYQIPLKEVLFLAETLL